MEQLKIGIDIDETICDHLTAICDFYHQQRGVKVDPAQLTHDHALAQLWGISYTEVGDVYTEFHRRDGHEKLRSFPEARPALNRLNQHHQLLIVTARDPDIADKTEDWLEQHFGDLFSAVHFTRFRSKAPICLRERLDVIIDDSPQQALYCAQAGVKVILLDKPWNQDADHPLITRAVGWDQAEAVIEKMAVPDHRAG